MTWVVLISINYCEQVNSQIPTLLEKKRFISWMENIKVKICCHKS